MDFVATTRGESPRAQGVFSFDSEAATLIDYAEHPNGRIGREGELAKRATYIVHHASLSATIDNGETFSTGRADIGVQLNDEFNGTDEQLIIGGKFSSG